MNTGVTDAMNFQFLENFLLNINLTKAAEDTGLHGGKMWGMDPRLSFPTSDQSLSSCRKCSANTVKMVTKTDGIFQIS